MEPQKITPEEHANFIRGLLFVTSFMVILVGSVDLGYHFIFEKPIGNTHLEVVGALLILSVGCQLILAKKQK